MLTFTTGPAPWQLPALRAKGDVMLLASSSYSYPLLGALAVRFEGATRPTGAGEDSGVSWSAAAAPAAEVSAELASPG